MHPDELEHLCRRHTPALFPFVLNLLRNEADAEDVLQEVFVTLARDPARLEGVRSMRPFLFRLTHNLAVDLIRSRESRSRAHSAAGLEVPRLFLPAPAADAEMDARELEAALGELPVEQRAVVHLKLWGDLTFEAIAEVLQVSPNTAASRYRYALGKLRDRLRPLYDEIRQNP